MKIIKNTLILITFLFSSQLVLAKSDFLVNTDWLEKNINNEKKIMKKLLSLKYSPNDLMKKNIKMFISHV